DDSERGTIAPGKGSGGSIRQGCRPFVRMVCRRTKDMAKTHSIRDPVHNFVRLRDKEVNLINAPVFQRLRGIRQLALANLVYPGAVHTRFDHSLGVCHVAGLMADELDLPPDQVELVRLAALLHDLGHGPFSHVSELSLERFADRGTLEAGQQKDKI